MQAEMPLPLLSPPCFCPRGTKQGLSVWYSPWSAAHWSLSRLVKVTDTGQVVYKAEKDACRAFPDPRADDLEAGAKRNFQILSPLDFLAEFMCAHSAQRFSWRSLLWLLFEQVTGNAQEGRRGSIPKSIESRQHFDGNVCSLYVRDCLLNHRCT